MQRKLAAIGLASLLMTTTNTALAAGYVSGLIGKTDYAADDISDFDKGTSLAITVGYKVNQNVALEASYIDLGDAEDDIAPVWTLSADGLAFAVRGIAPLSPEVDLYGKAGIYMWDAKLEQDGFGEIASDDGTDLLLGVGISFAVNAKVELMAEYLRVEVDSEDVSNVGLGVRVNF